MQLFADEKWLANQVIFWGGGGGGGEPMFFCLIDIWKGSIHYVFKLERSLIDHGKFQNSKLPES